MDKRNWHHLWTKVRPIKPWYFLLAASVTGSIGVMGLRANSLEMADLRTAVYAADKSGEGVEQALQNLQMYVTSHMNTDLSAGPNAPYPPIQLVYTYDRAVQAVGEKATASNRQIYTDAQAYCEKLDPVDFSGHNRVPCVQQYIENHGVALPVIPDSLYEFAFASPIWSPDVAGWSLLATALLLIAFVSSYLVDRFLKHKAK